MPAVVNVAEFMRRMSEMNSFYRMAGEEAAEVTLVVNLSSPCVQALKTADENEQKLIATQIYLLALLAYRQLKPEEIEEFSSGQTEIMQKYLEKR